MAVHELGVRQVMAIAASAFFATTDWRERVWEAMRATTQFQATHPLLTHVGFVESHAVGEPAIQNIEDSRRAFTIFLQEGNQYTQDPPSNTAREAIAAAIFEIAYRQARKGQARQMPRFAGYATYLALAPFLGPGAAENFIDGIKSHPGDVRPPRSRG